MRSDFQNDFVFTPRMFIITIITQDILINICLVFKLYFPFYSCKFELVVI